MKTVLTSLLMVFPEPFRTQFASGMVEQIERDYDLARARGRIAAFWFALATAVDLMRSGIAERWSPNWVDPDLPPEEARGMSGTLSAWARELRYAWRSLRRTPGFTLIAAGMLGLAIGATAGMFTVVKTVLLDPLPYANADRLVQITASAPGSDMPPEFGVSAEFLLHYKERSKLLEDVSTVNSFTNTLRVGDRVERVRMSWPTNSLYSTLGAKPILGRLPVTEDERNVAVISYALWKSWFGSDPGVIGQVHEMGGGPKTIIGVMGPEFKFPNDGVLLWMSSEVQTKDLQPGRFGARLVARTKPGVTAEALADELTALAKELPDRFGGTPAYAKVISQHRAIVKTLEEALLGSVSRPLWVLLGATAIVLLIACANIANLFLVRAEGRHRDLAVRRALGAGRTQLIRLQMAEALIVAAIGGALAVGFAALVFPVFLGSAPEDIPRLGQVGLGLPTVLFTLVAAVACALACGAVPALRGSVPDLTWLRAGSRGSTARRPWLRNALVVAQTALALVLLIGSGLLVRSFWALQNVDPGYDTKDIFTFQIAPDRPELKDGPTFARFDLDFLDRLATLPGVEVVGLVENIPLNEGTAGERFRTEAMGDEKDVGTLLRYTWTAGDYFKAMGISVLQGKTFEQDDHVAPRSSVILSKSAANLLWPGQDPLGKRLQPEDPKAWFTVVGVVEDVMQNNFREAADPLVYFPLAGPKPEDWTISSPAYVLKTARADVIAPEVRALVREIAPEAPMYRVYTMAGLAKDSMADVSFTMLTLGIASALALILGAVGLYGVLSYVVAERTREIGVRMALGARAEQVRSMVVMQGLRIVGVGVAIGVVAAVVITRALESLLFGVQKLDPATFAGMSVTMVAIGVLASYLPARRASRVDPIQSLRSD